MTRINPLNAYKETRIKTASQGQLIIMLYDEAIKNLDIAIELLGKGTKSLDKVNHAVIRAQEMITELLVSLDFEKGGDIASNLFSLYMFFNQTMMEANLKKDVELLRTIRPMLSDLRETWGTVIAKTDSAGETSPGSGVNIAG